MTQEPFIEEGIKVPLHEYVNILVENSDAQRQLRIVIDETIP